MTGPTASGASVPFDSRTFCCLERHQTGECQHVQGRSSTPDPSNAHDALVRAQEALLAHKRYSAESEIVHVTPVNDLADHSEVACWCGPEIETLRRIDGGTRYLITHHSLDGRESDDASSTARIGDSVPPEATP